jgi:hypothetical protein
LFIPTLQRDPESGRFQKLTAFDLEYTIKQQSRNQQLNSVLASGTWYKIGITAESVYRIDANWLGNQGIDPSGIDPRTIKIFGNGGKMLPQANDVSRPFDLIENAIQVVGEEDGVFNPSDYILFYGQQPHGLSYDTLQHLFQFEQNFYSDTTFYYLTWGDETGKRIETTSDLGDTRTLITHCPDYRHYENEDNTILLPASGRRRFGERFSGNLNQSFTFDLENVYRDSSLYVQSVVAGQTFEETHFELSANGSLVGRQRINRVLNTTYGVRGVANDTLIRLDPSAILGSSSDLVVDLFFDRVFESQTSVGFLDFLQITFNRELVFEGQPTIIRYFPEPDANSQTFSIKTTRSDLQIWDITDPYGISSQPYRNTGNEVLFTRSLEDPAQFALFNPTNLPQPTFKGGIKNQNLKGLSPTTLLIITTERLLSQARRYADYKEMQENIPTTVVTVREIYNEFSSGSQDVSALRDFIRYLFLKDTGGNGLKYVLLFGKGSNDYKDLGPVNFNLVPTYQSRNSLDNIFSYSSDDYYGFMDENEGEWIETADGDHLLDLGIGRIPVKNADEAAQVGDKLIHYKTASNTFGTWRNRIVFVADDQDNNAHQEDAEDLANIVSSEYPPILIDKLYLDAYPQINTPTQRAPDFNEALVERIEDGALIINFSGHGGETGWMNERTFQFPEIDGLRNLRNLPLFVTATCEFGRHDDPTRIAGGERLILNPSGGAVALITTARPVFRFSNFLLNKSLFEAAFEIQDGRFPTLGEIMIDTKNNSLRGPNNRNFSLLGDPSMTLNYPDLSVQTERIVNARNQASLDTLKALSRIQVHGVVSEEGEVVDDFNGTVNIKIFDQSEPLFTRGTDDDSFPMEYTIKNNILFNGRATVNNGKFSFETIIPKTINFSFEEAEINYYAQMIPAEGQGKDGNGSDRGLIIGGSESITSGDGDGPDISVFLNDSLFQNGGVTGPDALFIARLSDESGINTSASALGHEIKLILDGNEEWNLNNAFISDLDDFTHGWVYFNLDNLSKGKHTLEFEASDSYNNRSRTTLEFIVGDQPGIRINQLSLFPNPVRAGNRVEWQIVHNRLSDDVRVTIAIMNMNGELVFLGEDDFLASNGVIDQLYWNGQNDSGGFLGHGVYIVQTTLHSLSDGSNYRTANRLILIN